MSEIAIGITALGLMYFAFNLDEKEHIFLRFILIITALTDLMLIPRSYISEYPYFYYTSMFGYVAFWLYLSYYYLKQIFTSGFTVPQMKLSKNGK